MDYKLSIMRPVDIIHRCAADMGEQGSSPRGNEAGEFHSAPNVHGQRDARAEVQAGKTVSRLCRFLAGVFSNMRTKQLDFGLWKDGRLDRACLQCLWLHFFTAWTEQGDGTGLIHLHLVHSWS